MFTKASKKSILVLMIVALVMSLTACGSKKEATTGNTTATTGGAAKSISINAAGSSFIAPLFQKMISEYNKSHPNIKINYQSIGSGGGQRQLKAETIDFAASDAFMTDAQVKDVPSGVIHIPMTFGAEAITYNLKDKDGKAIGKGLKLTAKTLSEIYLGKITKWNDPQLVADNANLNLPDQAITVVHRSDGSGTTAIYTDYLSHVSADWKDKVGQGSSVKWPVGIGGKGNEGVSGAVKQTPGTIGYVELAYAVNNKLPYAQLKNQAGVFLFPTLKAASLAAAAAPERIKNDDTRISLVNMPGKDAYGIVGQTWVLLKAKYDDADKKKAIIDFIKWGYTKGQDYSEALLYAKVPEAIVTINDKNIAKVQ